MEVGGQGVRYPRAAADAGNGQCTQAEHCVYRVPSHGLVAAPFVENRASEKMLGGIRIQNADRNKKYQDARQPNLNDDRKPALKKRASGFGWIFKQRAGLRFHVGRAFRRSDSNPAVFEQRRYVAQNCARTTAAPALFHADTEPDGSLRYPAVHA